MDYSEQIKSALSGINMDQLNESFAQIGAFVKSIDFSPLTKAAEEISSRIQPLLENYKLSLQPIIEKLKDLPSFDDLRTMLSWGNFGWGLIEFVPREPVYFKQVTSCQEADLILEPYLTDKVVNNLFTEVRNKLDGNSISSEAEECFEEEKYRSCILLLFSLIDGTLINIQEVKENRKRPLTNRLVKKIKEKTDLNELTISAYITIGITLNALSVLFADGEDFQNEPKLVNRNFISHGMSTRQITRLDCIKVLSVLNNVLDMIYFKEFDDIMKKIQA